MNKHERRAIESYGKIAGTYDDSFEGRFTLPFNQKLTEVVKLPDNGRLLDVACGNGRLLKMLQHKNTFDGYGTDISHDMIKVASRDIPDMTFMTASCDRLPFDNSFFDVITVCAAFHHFPDIDAFAKEAKRVLKPNGSLYIADVYYSPLLRILINPFIRFHPSGDVRLYSPKEIKNLLQKFGFKCDEALIENNMQTIIAHNIS